MRADKQCQCNSFQCFEVKKTLNLSQLGKGSHLPWCPWKKRVEHLSKGNCRGLPVWSKQLAVFRVSSDPMQSKDCFCFLKVQNCPSCFVAVPNCLKTSKPWVAIGFHHLEGGKISGTFFFSWWTKYQSFTQQIVSLQQATNKIGSVSEGRIQKYIVANSWLRFLQFMVDWYFYSPEFFQRFELEEQRQQAKEVVKSFVWSWRNPNCVGMEVVMEWILDPQKTGICSNFMVYMVYLPSISWIFQEFSADSPGDQCKYLKKSVIMAVLHWQLFC